MRQSPEPAHTRRSEGSHGFDSTDDQHQGHNYHQAHNRGRQYDPPPTAAHYLAAFHDLGSSSRDVAERRAAMTSKLHPERK